MDKHELRNRIEYIVAIVSSFAERFGLTIPNAYAYLRRFSGIDLLIKHYGIMHTLSIEDVVDDLQQACFNRGGRIA
ncbi:MAG: DUF3791 domain-containing protein [Muribaculaceae bacterium]|nr:DUF3791 domain-containing protein [Muribaculaceae bacterium]